MLRLEFNKVLDKYLETGEISLDDYNALEFTQEIVIQEIKRAFARAKLKENIAKSSLVDPISGLDCSQIPF